MGVAAKTGRGADEAPRGTPGLWVYIGISKSHLWTVAWLATVGSLVASTVALWRIVGCLEILVARGG